MIKSPILSRSDTSGEIAITEHSPTPPAWLDETFSRVLERDSQPDATDTIEYDSPLGEAMTRPLVLSRSDTFREINITEHSPIRPISNEKICALPPPLREILETVPKSLIRVVQFDRVSPFDKFKALVEDRTGFEWNWWPLRPCRRPIVPGTARLEWNCAGHQFYNDISVTDAGIAVDVLNEREEHPVNCYCCQAEAQTASWLRRLKMATTSVAASSSSASESGSSTAPSSVPSRASTKYRPRKGSPSKGSESGDDLGIGSQDQMSDHSSEDTRTSATWLLFGVQGWRETVELEDLFIHEEMKDLELFSLLKTVHAKHRGWAKTWTSPFRFQTCRFVKFQVYGDRVLSSEKEDLPDDYGYAEDYDYTPRPPQAKMPLINSNEFKLYLSACITNCKMASFLPSFWHDCFVPPPEAKLLQRIPKKRSRLCLSGQGCEDVAFGLEAEYVISFISVIAYHLLLIVPAFGFWAYWLLQRPGDLQNASVPVFTVIAIITVFWTTTAKESLAPRRSL